MDIQEYHIILIFKYENQNKPIAINNTNPEHSKYFLSNQSRAQVLVLGPVFVEALNEFLSFWHKHSSTLKTMTHTNSSCCLATFGKGTAGSLNS